MGISHTHTRSNLKENTKWMARGRMCSQDSGAASPGGPKNGDWPASCIATRSHHEVLLGALGSRLLTASGSARRLLLIITTGAREPHGAGNTVAFGEGARSPAPSAPAGQPLFRGQRPSLQRAGARSAPLPLPAHNLRLTPGRRRRRRSPPTPLQRAPLRLACPTWGRPPATSVPETLSSTRN